MVLQVEIAFTNGFTLESTKEPHFLGDAGIDGYVTLTDQRDIEFDLVKLTLEGTLVNVIRYSDWFANSLFEKAQKLLKLTDVKRSADFIGGIRIVEHPQKMCFFHFEIPKCLDCEILGHNSGFLRDLPASSLCNEHPDRSAVLQERCQGDCYVSYKLHVQVLHQGESLTSCTQRIKIIPTLGSRPPVCVADFPGEYNLTKSRYLRDGFLSMRRRGYWQLEASEPVSPALTHITDRILLSTSLQLTHTTYSTKGHHEWKPRDIVNCQCTCSLISLTFISSKPRRSVPTLQEASTSPSLSRNLQTCARIKVTVQFSKWREFAYTLRAEGDSSDAITQWKADALVTLDFGEFMYLAPSFESSLVSRRYKLALFVRITKPHRTTFHLSLPVQIFYQTNEACRPWSFAETESPPYVA